MTVRSRAAGALSATVGIRPPLALRAGAHVSGEEGERSERLPLWLRGSKVQTLPLEVLRFRRERFSGEMPARNNDAVRTSLLYPASQPPVTTNKKAPWARVGGLIGGANRYLSALGGSSLLEQTSHCKLSPKELCDS